MASPLKGETKADQGLLRIWGLTNKDTSFVTPGLVTLNQLKTYLKGGSLVYRFRGEVYFPQLGRPDWKPGSLVLSGTYHVINKKAIVRGRPNLQRFPAHPAASVEP